MAIYYTYWNSPLAPILLLSDGAALTGLYLARHTHLLELRAEWRREEDAFPFAQARRQIAAYFAGERAAFTLPLAPQGTVFQRSVWDELTHIPYGATCSYGELARRLGSPNASRAVGRANGCNPLSLVIPCHRVVGASGKLTGYSGGLSCKARLLALEAGKGRFEEPPARESLPGEVFGSVSQVL